MKRQGGKARDFGKVAVLFGGRSSEREISLISGQAVLDALRRKGVDAHAFDPAERPLQDLLVEQFDRAFIVLHGKGGEDGAMQGALEWLGIPYTGSGVLASALAMDKWRTKQVWRQAGIPTPKYCLLRANEDWARVVDELGLPLMVKPVGEGSSIGMSKVESREALPQAYALAARYGQVVIAEEFIHGVELTAAILDQEALPLIRLETPRVFYDYEAKYKSDSTRYICPCGLPPEVETRVQGLARRAFAAIGCTGWGRADVMLDENNEPWFLELNTVPGMTDHSLVPMAARAAGIEFDELVCRILEGAHVG